MKNLYEPNTFLSLIQLCDYFGLQLLTTASLLSLSLSHSLSFSLMTMIPYLFWATLAYNCAK